MANLQAGNKPAEAPDVGCLVASLSLECQKQDVCFLEVTRVKCNSLGSFDTVFARQNVVLVYTTAIDHQQMMKSSVVVFVGQ